MQCSSGIMGWVFWLQGDHGRNTRHHDHKRKEQNGGTDSSKTRDEGKARARVALSALTAAETGHLVFATLHTQDAPQTIDRIIDVFPPHQQQQVRVQLAGSLQGIFSQQLLPTTDGTGRVVAVEVLVPNSAVRNLIREGKTHQIYSVMQTGAKHGMLTMDASLADLYNRGRITRETALSKSSDPESLRALLASGGVAI